MAAVLCLLLLASSHDARMEGSAGIPQGESIIRVALGVGQNSARLSVVHGAYTLVNPDNGAGAGAMAIGQGITVSPSGSGLQIAKDGAAIAYTGSRIALSPGGGGVDIVMYNQKTYRGGFVVENRSGVLNVINALDVDDYLLGVLPMEMGMSTAPVEALKAQAVVSRTYALKKKNAGGSYDLVSGSSDQMYGGFGSEKAYTDAAVLSTRGQVIQYDGQLIEAFFSSNSGGYTEDAENVWNASLPYARAVPSPHDAYALEALQDGDGYPGVTYQWQVRYTMGELQERIAEWNKGHPDDRISIGNLQGMEGFAYAYDPDTRRITSKPNTSGRITLLDLHGSSGTYPLHRESVRTFLGLRSTLFTIKPEGGIAVRNGAGATVMLGQGLRESMGLVADGMPAEINPGSDSFYVATAEGVVQMHKDEASTVTAYVFDGKGYGHGVGLSQWGAIGMANAGMTYGQIIEHYYNQGRNDGRLSVRAVQ
ncbi:MAG: SpoIID/LytB domain-containing protein [Clostridiales bacterium]|nr:SpoIID/LytB domain-containing protein [Clostridiales bacterium]